MKELKIMIHNYRFNLENFNQFLNFFATFLKPKDIVLLTGEMGVGKTTFVANLMKVYDFESSSSPTFSLANRYETHSQLFFHLDLYRMRHEQDLQSMDIQQYLEHNSAITFIEWPEKLGVYQPESYISLSIQFDENEAFRKFRLDFSFLNDQSRHWSFGTDTP